MTGPATFSLFVRDLPPCRGFLAAARRRFEQDLVWLPGQTRVLTEPVPVTVQPTAALTALRDRLSRALCGAGRGR